MSSKPASVLPPGEYVTKSDVFVLDPHTLKDKHGDVIVDVTEKMLQKIAANQNKRVAETGDATPLVIGHTKDEAHEHEQPEVVGYATDWKVKKFFRTGKHALACTFHLFKKSVDKVRKFPRRSVELWLDSLTIDPISLLGATTPERDLGLLKLSKASGGSKIVASLDDSGELSVDENTQQIVDAVLEAIKSTDVWQFMTQKMEEDSAGQGDSPSGAGDESPLAGAEGGPEGGEFDPASGQGLADALGGGEPDGDEGGEMPTDVPTEEQEPVQMSAATASGSNTFAPAGMGNRPQQYSKVSFAKLVRENEDIKSALNSLIVRYRRSEREKDLIQLESEGYMLDRSEELSLCDNLTDDQFKAHLTRVRHRYQKAPVGAMPYIEQTAAVNRGRSTDDAMAVARYAINNKCSYEEALAALSSSKSVY
jgi:hypothetical protein